MATEIADLPDFTADDDTNPKAVRLATARREQHEAAAKRWVKKGADIDETQKLLERGAIHEVESEKRLALWHARRADHEQRLREAPRTLQPDGLGLERKLGMTTDFVSIEFFEAGLIAARSIGMVNLDIVTGTGFLVGLNLLMTNNHVIPTEEDALDARLIMDHELNLFGEAKTAHQFKLNPDRFFATDESLDFTIVAVQPVSSRGRALADYGSIPMIVGEGKIRVGDSVNIIQHPQGEPKQVVVHDSRLIFLKNNIRGEEFCFYTSDTDEGSSGAPVFNDRWEVIALHHASVPQMNKNGELINHNGRLIGKERARANPEEIVWIANEGVRTSRLVKRIEKMNLPKEMDEIRRQLLASWAAPESQTPVAHEAAHKPVDVSTDTNVQIDGGSVTIPLSITLKLG